MLISHLRTVPAHRKHTFPFSFWRMYETRDEYNLKEYVATRNSAVNPLDPIRDDAAPDCPRVGTR